MRHGEVLRGSERGELEGVGREFFRGEGGRVWGRCESDSSTIPEEATQFGPFLDHFQTLKRSLFCLIGKGLVIYDWIELDTCGRLFIFFNVATLSFRPFLVLLDCVFMLPGRSALGTSTMRNWADM